MNDDTAPITTNTGNETYIGAIDNNQNRINIEIVSMNIINFEEIKVEDHSKLEIDSFEHVVILEKMGSNCLVNLRLRSKSHGLWRTTLTYQWKYSW